MKKFVCKILIAALALATCLCGTVALDALVVGPQYSEIYNAAIYDKLAYISEIEGPKIILVGNSNLAFGMDSAMLEEAVGMPVVNLGLHGGLGNAFHENIARPYIGEGDIVIVCHSSYSGSAGVSDHALAWSTVEKRFDLLSYVDPGDYFDMARAYPTYLRKAVKRYITGTGNIDIIDDSYSRLSFNERGDIATRPARQQLPLEVLRSYGIARPRLDAENARRLNELNAYVESKSATMLIAAYPIADGAKTPDREVYIAFQEKLARELDCAVISDFTDYFMPYEYFYNTALHLNDEGVRVRTQQLIDDVLRWREANGEA